MVMGMTGRNLPGLHPHHHLHVEMNNLLVYLAGVQPTGMSRGGALLIERLQDQGQDHAADPGAVHQLTQ